MSQHNNKAEMPTEEIEELSIHRTVAAEAEAVQVSNRGRQPVISKMADGTKRIDF